ncbi:RelA/SpoT family protein [Tenuifilum thalassicum]|uniref:Bifunctional (P)ppGpp synthetase/guanosine-3',5'-bis(Diphosphate) 3'-pyrophosphohydrolase n=1 Tax=Tenuifilum thalassicum TaxID=2590900 RepID=A0A7D4BAJ0_9BACT|nr:RelA/SpoT family protein [Tenuifilum thalassicum]QKG79420.1 bifunctional (p)ppGpp synthetase/guanosine-3',5'-bis(diphosphate) 3'-pyrophosphohydrolase [Tenuifilum thalassicum]
MDLQTEEEKRLIQEHFEDLLKSCTRCNTEEGKQLVVKAFNLANEAHKGVKRKSGEPYILHPIAVAKIVTSEIGLGAKAVACALMHDVVEDTDYTVEDIERMFGKKIASIIDGLTKITDVFDANSTIQAENFRKILLTLAEDIRVILIKLADRLHNMRTLDSLPTTKQMKIASETIYLYAPLAHRLGLYAIKTELEDLSLKYRYPKVYEEIRNKIADNEKHRQQLINHFSLPIIQKLEENNIDFEISGRPKSVYSIWKKMQTKNVSFEEIYDLLAVRIVFNPYPHIPEKTQCWHIYSLITDIYKPKPDRLRDWVSTPKANGYEALHCTVMGPDGKWVEVQIRSRRMDDIAERGFAAHWKYKEMDTTTQENELDKWIRRVREMLENPQENALEFLDEFKLNLFTSEIIVFTPKGETRSLPKGATALDFAYEIHTEIGNKAIGAKVNHKLVPLSHRLNTGDQVEIITAASQKPSWEQLDFATTAKAKAAIKSALKGEVRNRIEKGQKLLEEKLLEMGIQPSSRVFKKILPAYEATSKDELYAKIGSGLVNLDNLRKILKKNTQSKWIKYWKLQLGRKDNKQEKKEDEKIKYDLRKPFVIGENTDTENPSYIVAKCCNPIPGDEVVGYLSPDDIVVVHKATCAEAVRLMAQHGDKIVAAKWTTQKALSFLARIEVSGMDRIGIILELTRVISEELMVNIRKFYIESHDGIFEGYIDLYVHDVTHLNNLILNIMKIKGIDNVKRIDKFDD